MPDLPASPPRSELLIYQTEDGRTRIQVRLEDETVWLTQADMARLFQTTPQNITLHLKNIFQEGELDEAANCKDFLQVQTEAGRQVQRSRKFYNLDAIISVGYRIKSHVATRFRQWATQRLREYIVKGFTLDDERLKQAGGGDYFDELLAGPHPGYQGVGEGVLAKGTRYLRHEHRLRPECRNVPPFLPDCRHRATGNPFAPGPPGRLGRCLHPICAWPRQEQVLD